MNFFKCLFVIKINTILYLKNIFKYCIKIDPEKDRLDRIALVDFKKNYIFIKNCINLFFI